MLKIAITNLKGGSAKTTSTAYLAHALGLQGRNVLVVDADPQGSALRWSEVGEWETPTIGLPVKDLHTRLPGIVPDSIYVVIIDSPVNWLGQPETARFVIILGLLWRWTGYNMIFYLAGLQNIDPTTIEEAKIDGAGAIRTFWSVTLPQLRPMILLTVIMPTNGTLQLFDESYNLTRGGPAYTSMTMSHYLYEVSFQRNPNFGYGAALSYVILIMVAILAAIQMRVGDKRD